MCIFTINCLNWSLLSFIVPPRTQLGPVLVIVVTVFTTPTALPYLLRPCWDTDAAKTQPLVMFIIILSLLENSFIVIIILLLIMLDLELLCTRKCWIQNGENDWGQTILMLTVTTLQIFKDVHFFYSCIAKQSIHTPTCNTNTHSLLAHPV